MIVKGGNCNQERQLPKRDILSLYIESIWIWWEQFIQFTFDIFSSFCKKWIPFDLKMAKVSILLVAYLSYFLCEVKPICSTIPLWGFTGGSVQRNGFKKLLSTSPKEYSDLKICEWCKHISFRTKWQQNSWWVTMSTLILAPSGFNFLENDYSCEFRNKVLLKKNSPKNIHWKG